MPSLSAGHFKDYFFSQCDLITRATLSAAAFIGEIGIC